MLISCARNCHVHTYLVQMDVKFLKNQKYALKGNKKQTAKA